MLHGSAVAAGISDDVSIACQRCATMETRDVLTMRSGLAGSRACTPSGSRQSEKR